MSEQYGKFKSCEVHKTVLYAATAPTEDDGTYCLGCWIDSRHDNLREELAGREDQLRDITACLGNSNYDSYQAVNEISKIVDDGDDLDDGELDYKARDQLDNGDLSQLARDESYLDDGGKAPFDPHGGEDA